MEDRWDRHTQREDNPLPNTPRTDGGQRSDAPRTGGAPQRDDAPQAGRSRPSASGPQHSDTPRSGTTYSAGNAAGGGTATPQTAKHGGGTAAPQTAKHGGCLKWILILFGVLALISVFRSCCLLYTSPSPRDA